MRRKISAAIVAAGMMVMNSAPVLATVDVNALPQFKGGNNVNVQTGDDITGNFTGGKPDMNVQIQGDAGSVGTANWNSFDIGSNKHVNFEFTAHNQTSLNRVEAAGGMSQIYGQMTNSCGSNCGYASTGKVILINPNGVLFGTGANVNLNSFTVSTLDGQYTPGADGTKGGSLTLTPNTSEAYNGKNKGIIAVQDGATIYGDKAVNFAADNRIILYEGSKIKTNIGNNAKYTSGTPLAMGNVRLVTADGVTFKYENNGATTDMPQNSFKASNKEMNIDVQGYIESGKVDIRNYSSNVNSELNVYKGTIKAVKAVKGNDGSIWLTANNHVVVDDSNLITSNMDGAEAVDGGNIQILAGQKASVKDSNLKAVGNIKSESVNLNSVIEDSILTADKNVDIKAAEKASIQKGSKVAGNNITVNGTKEANVLNSAINAQGDITILSDSSISTENSDILTKGNITLESKGDVSLVDSTFAQEKDEDGNVTKRATGVKVSAKNNITDESLSGSTFNGDLLVLESTDESIKLGDLSNTQFNSSSKQPTQFKAGKNIEIVKKEGDLTVPKWSFEAGDDILLQAEAGKVKFTKGAVDNFQKGDRIILKALTNISTDANGEAVNLNGIQTTMEAGNNINVKVKGVDVREKALIAKAGKNMNVTAEGDLAVSELISGNNMTLKADNILSGSPKSSTNHYFKNEGDSSEDRAYIEVGGTFTTYETERTSDENAEGQDAFNVTDSTDLTDDGQFNKKHWIEFGKNKDEKVLLVNKRPVNYQKEEPDITIPNRGGLVDPEDPSTAQPGDGNPGPSVEPVDPNPDKGNYEEQYDPNKEYDDDCEKAPGIDEEGSELPEIEDPELPENPSAEEKSPVPPTDENELPMMPLSEISLKNVDSAVNSVGTYTLKLEEIKK